MSKRKQAHGRSVQNRQAERQLDPHRQGLRAFEAGHFDQAITIWQGLTQHDAPVKAAPAEAYFRRSLIRTLPEEQVAEKAMAIRRYYQGVAAAQSGDTGTALARWQSSLDAGLAMPWLLENLVTARLQHLTAQLEVDSPFLGMALPMGPLLDDLDIDDRDFDFDDMG